MEVDLARVGPPWDDLAPVAAMIGDARVVAISEPVHGALEPLAWRNRLFEYLAKEHGFTAIAIESGLAEGRVIHEYVRSGTGTAALAANRGFSWTFGELPQNSELLASLRAWNAARVQPINIYGFDLSGSPGCGTATRGIGTALADALAYIDDADQAAAARFRARLSGVVEHLCFDLFASKPGSYPDLNAAERDRLSAIIADLIGHLECHEHALVARTGEFAWRWALALARDASRCDQWLRQLPLGWQPIDDEQRLSPEQQPFVSASHNVRDRAQAENIRWILETEGPGAKILLFAARVHLITAPIVSAIASQEMPSSRQVPAGSYLRRWYGGAFVSICAVHGGGRTSCGAYRGHIEPPPPSSLDGWAQEISPRPFLLDLRKAPDSLAAVLEEPWTLVAGDQTLNVAPAAGFDIVHNIGAVSPAGDARRGEGGLKRC